MEGVLLKKQEEEEEEEEEMQEESLERRQPPPQGHTITAIGSPKNGGGREDKGLLESLESIKDTGTVTNIQDWGSLENEQVIDLEMLVEKPDSCDFYCPKCKSCITTIVLIKRQQEELLKLKQEQEILLKLKEEQALVPEKKPIIQEKDIVIPEQRPIIQEDDVVIAEQKPIIQEEERIDIPEQKPIIQEEERIDIPEQKPIIQEEERIDIPEQKPIIQEEERIVVPEQKPIIQEIECPSCLSFIVPITSSCLDYCVRRPAGLLTSCFTTSDVDSRPRPGPVEAGTSKILDILKCIVYGGLNESITSLSVVISAASADAATLKILALGFANLIGGLFLFGHGLMLLKNDTRTGETNGQGDRYEELLGQRGNFLLHSTVAVLSFLVFGLVPLVTFGFTFLKSDNRDLKLVAVVAAAVVCITILAIGKAYNQKASTFLSYLKTIVYYVSAGLAVSGVSYILGDMIKKALEKLGWFKSSVAVSLPITEIGVMKQALGSY